jgi:hypothetical protein
MRKLTTAKWAFIASLIVAGTISTASAGITRNGQYYTPYSTTSKCPDGSKTIRYSKKTWCPTYRATLNWSIPTTRENGKALQLSELAGYEIYWTRASDSKTGVIKVIGGQIAKQQFETFVPANYYFAMSAIDRAGLKSKLSTLVNTPLKK